MELDFINLSFELKSASETKEKGIPIGIITGYLATWDIDRGKDRFEQGAFRDSLAEHRNKSRMIRMKAYHETIIGGFPIENVKEDENGLYVEGHINLETQSGREVYALAKQGVLTDFSIGYSVQESDFERDIRVIRKASIWEGSIVDEPMNPKANINEVKAVTPRASLPKVFADMTYRWDAAEAERRIKEYAEKSDCQAFLWENGSDCKFLVSDIVEGEVKLIPRAIIAARAVLSGAKNGADISATGQARIKNIINDLYVEMGQNAPFDAEGKAAPYCTSELKNMSRSTLSDAIRFGVLSKGATTQLVNAIESGVGFKTDSELEEEQALKELTELKNFLTGV